jgi:hypothetical protein
VDGDPITDHFRMAISMVTALALGVSTYASAIAISSSGILGNVWQIVEVILFGLAAFGVFLVYRWWALLPAIVPVAVHVFLQNATDVVPPQSDSEWRFGDQPFVYILWVILAVIVQAASLAIGLLLRAIWEWCRSRRTERSLRGSADE